MNSFGSFIGTVSGLIVNNTYLATHYHFGTWGELNFTTFSLDRFIEVGNGFLSTFGFVAGRVNVKNIYYNGVSMLIIILICFSIWRLKNCNNKINKFYTAFYIFAILIFVAVYTFTDMEYTGRYNYPILVFSWPLIVLGIQEHHFMRKKLNITPLMIIFTGIIMIRSGLLMNDNIELDRVGELREVSNYLNNSTCHYTYATFLNGNIISELTNGAIEIYHWRPGGAGNTDDVYKFLQKVSHAENYPEANMAVVYRNDEITSSINEDGNEKPPAISWANQLNKEKIVFQTENYTVYGYKNYDEFANESTSESQI